MKTAKGAGHELGAADATHALEFFASSAMEKAASVEFPFEYKGGGYWRRKGAATGEAAEILHGDQAIEWLRAAIRALKPVQDK